MAKNWSEDRVAEFRALHEGGMTFVEIAGRFGLTVRNVQAKAQRLGMSRRNIASRHADPVFLQLRSEGKSAKEIADAMGVSFKRVQNWTGTAINLGLISKMARPTPSWPEAREAELRRLWGLGLCPVEIARLIGGNRNIIDNKARKLGLPRDRGYPKNRKPAPPRNYRRDHLVGLTRKPRPPVTTVIWDKTELSRPFMERSKGECAWPLGERGDIHSCCQPTLTGDSYCEHHRLLAGGMRVPGHQFGRTTKPDHPVQNTWNFRAAA